MKKGILLFAFGLIVLAADYTVAQEAQEQTPPPAQQQTAGTPEADKEPEAKTSEKEKEQPPTDDQKAEAAQKEASEKDPGEQEEPAKDQAKEESAKEPVKEEDKEKPAEEPEGVKKEAPVKPIEKEEPPAQEEPAKKPAEKEKSEKEKPEKEKKEEPAKKPEKPKEKAPAKPVEKEKSKEQEPSLLDTIDIEEGGNWVLKRKALQDTVRKIEDINDLYDKIRDTNTAFLQGINTVDTLFTKFSFDVGYDLGKVDQMVQDVSTHMDEEQDEEGHLSAAERAILQKASEHQKELGQLQTDMQDVWKAYTQLKEARTINDDQIIESDRLRKQAWGNFRLIERVLSEVKAEQLYQETVQLYESMQRTYQYLQTKLIPHFQQSVSLIQQKMKSIGAETDELQKLGILLSKQTDAVEREEEQMREVEQLEQEKEEVVQETGIWVSIKRVLWAPFAALGNLWNWITGAGDTSKYLPDAEDDTNE